MGVGGIGTSGFKSIHHYIYGIYIFCYVFSSELFYDRAQNTSFVFMDTYAYFYINDFMHTSVSEFLIAMNII